MPNYRGSVCLTELDVLQAPVQDRSRPDAALRPLLDDPALLPETGQHGKWGPRLEFPILFLVPENI